MTMMRKRGWASLGMAALLLVGAGCGTKSSEAPPETGKPSQPEQLAPVSLTLFKEDNGVSAETVEQLIRNKFPQVTLKVIKSGKGTMIDEVVASGETPDIISYSLGGLWKLKDLQLLSDLTPLIQTHKFDLNRFVDGVVDTVRSYSDNGAFLVMPFELNNNALFYNKDIFDKAGVGYPQDGMTWDQVYDLAKKLVRMDGNVQVNGFHYNFLNVIYKNQLALPFVDAKTNKAAVNNDAWAQWVKVMTAFYTIPGNQPPVDEKTAFLKNQTLAMRTGPNYITELAASNLNWDLVSFPSFSGSSLTGTQMNAPYYAIPPASKNKDAAFQVISYLMSDEVATELARQGRIPIVKSEAVRKEFGKGIAGLEHKNLAAFFKDTIAKPAPQTKFDGAAKSAFNAMIVSMLGGGKDTNTALRELEETVNKQIEQELRR
ncbi:ABC transporter substrate-binding protein [Paenibacillus hodogayensis]|uniref:ABC transporter substrate-binding protein n=1 Tax=Paenibacillus hodogayensis TaxID=279208 RepID=A0ABV5VYG7_9BACL